MNLIKPLEKELCVIYRTLYIGIALVRLSFTLIFMILFTYMLNDITTNGLNSAKVAVAIIALCGAFGLSPKILKSIEE